MNEDDSTKTSSGENIGLYITEWRRAKGLKQGNLALKLGMSAAQLCRLEKARHMPTFQTLRRLADALDIDIQDLTRRPDGQAPDANDPGEVAEPKTAFVEDGLRTMFVEEETYASSPPRSNKRARVPTGCMALVRPRIERKVLTSTGDWKRLREPLREFSGFDEAFEEEPHRESHPFPTPVLEATEPFLRGTWQARADVKILEYRLAEKRAGAPAKTSLPLHFPAEVEADDPEALARAVRTAGGIGVAPLPDAVSFLEDKGIRVIETTLPPDEDSLLFWDEADHNAWLFLNRATTDERQQFRAATELGNLLMYLARGRKAIPDTPLARRFAKDFAAAFLMPDAALRELSYQLGRKRDDWTLDLVYHVKQRFGVSAEAFTYRLALLNLIRQSLKSHFIKEIKAWYNEHGHTEPHPSNRKGSRRSRYDNLLELAGKQ